ncbi:hypothetical protein C0991_007703 [Blastosporella zonata]|nr:hypothetical protein C0991_007703 [Blastosporella zonata]
MDLPAEIWGHIFDIAADEDVIFQYGLPTMLSESIWVKGYASKWALRRPTDTLNFVQRSSYATKKVIWALDSLPSILCAHVDFESKSGEDSENVPLGSASDLQISLPHLQQLSLRGLFGQFLEEATGWTFPSLQCLSLDSVNHRTDQPDVVAFLTAHGTELTFLDLNCIPTLDVPEILDLCPKLVTFSFNADWRLQPPDEAMPASGSLTAAMATIETMSTLVNTPHPNIMMIGLHGLMYSFGVGYAAHYAAEEPLRAHVIGRSNDLNVAALNKANFPRLQCVRALSRAMLSDLNDADGPSEEVGMARYDKWWDALTAEGIRLEDCTGALLGTLPKEVGHEEEGEVEDGDDEEEEYDEDEDDNSEGDREEEAEVWELVLPPVPPQPGHGLSELRDLLDQCRMMAQTREPSIFAPMFAEVDGYGGAFVP